MEKMEWKKMEWKIMVKIAVDRLTATDCNAAARAKISITKMYRTVRVPAFEFNFNFMVCPLQGSANNVSKVGQ